MNLPDITSTVETLVAADSAVLSSTIIGELILDALDLFSQKLPRKILKDITGDGSQEYDLPSDEGLEWDNTFSLVLSIEYPTGNVPPIFLEQGYSNDFIIYPETTTTFKLKFISVTPGTSETIRLIYTIPWAESAVDDIPTTQQRAFVYLVATLCCEFLARYYSKASEVTQGADILVFRDKASTYAARAKEMQDRYNNLIGIEKMEDVKPASSTSDWDTVDPRGQDWLTHTNQLR